MHNSEVRLNEDEKICAVVVTYNRKNLLLECLNSLLSQTRPLQGIYLIDNASTDGTPELLLENGFIKRLPPKDLNEPWEAEFEIQNDTNGETVKFYYVRMNKNVGGAGGFYEGVKRAYERGYDWLWLMDDDTIAKNTSLSFLIEAKRKVSGYFDNIGYICSKVLWKEDEVHVMNVPQIKPLINDKIPFNILDEHGVLIVDGCSFVSLLLNRSAVENCGFPMKDFFIWFDDIEYTKRIINCGFIGLYSIKSVVFHKTKENINANILLDKPVNAFKYYYGTRNRLYMIRKMSLLLYIKAFIKALLIDTLTIIMKRKSNRFLFLYNHIKGIIASVFFNPRN